MSYLQTNDLFAILTSLPALPHAHITGFWKDLLHCDPQGVSTDLPVFGNTALTKYIPVPDTNTVLDNLKYLESFLGMAC